MKHLKSHEISAKHIEPVTCISFGYSAAAGRVDVDLHKNIIEHHNPEKYRYKNVRAYSSLTSVAPRRIFPY